MAVEAAGNASAWWTTGSRRQSEGTTGGLGTASPAAPRIAPGGCPSHAPYGRIPPVAWTGRRAPGDA